MDFLKEYKILETLNSLSWDNFIIRTRALLFLKILKFVDYLELTLNQKSKSSWGYWFKVKLGILEPEIESQPLSLVKEWSMLEDFKFRLSAWAMLDYLFSSLVSGLISLRRLHLFFRSYLGSKDSKKSILGVLQNNSLKMYAPKNFSPDQSIQKILWNTLFLNKSYQEIFDNLRSESDHWKDITQVRSFKKHDFYGILKKTSYFISTTLILIYFLLYLRSFYFYLKSLNSKKGIRENTKDMIIIFASLMLIFPFKNKLKENLIEKVKLSLKDLTFYFFKMPFKNFESYEELAFSTLSFLEFFSMVHRTSLFLIILSSSPLRSGLIQFLSWIKFLIKTIFSLKRISKRLLNNLESYEKFSYDSYTSSYYGFSFIFDKFYPGLKGSWLFDDYYSHSLNNGFYKWLTWANNNGYSPFNQEYIDTTSNRDLKSFRIVFNFWEVIVAINSFKAPMILKNFFYETFSNIFGIKSTGFSSKLLNPFRALVNWAIKTHNVSYTSGSNFDYFYLMVKAIITEAIKRFILGQVILFSNLFSIGCQLILGSPWVLGLLAIKTVF